MTNKIKKTIVPLSRTTVINLMRSGNWVNEGITEALKPFDISPQQFNVLRILRGQKGKPANLSTIQERMITKMSNTTRLVDKLLLKALAERTICIKNRRKVEISITSKGLELLKTIDPIIVSAEENIIKILNDEEINTLNILLEKIRAST